MRCSEIILLAATLGCATAPVAADTLTLRLRPQVVIDSPSVAIGQLVEFPAGEDGDGLATHVAAAQIRLDGAPGVLLRVTREDVAAVIALQVPTAASRVSWSGGNATFVRVAGHPLDPSMLVGQAQKALESWLGPRFASFRVAPVDTAKLDDSLALAGGESVTVRSFSGPLRSRTVVWIDIGVAGQPPRRSLPVWFSVEAMQSVDVAAHDLDRGTRLTREDIGQATIDVAEMGARRLLGEDEWETAISVGPVHRGDALTADRFRMARPVEAGDDVRLCATAGALTVEARAVALEAGHNGQRVRVRNSRSGEVLVAVVAGPDLVEVRP